jgi:hypothetical protein
MRGTKGLNLDSRFAKRIGPTIKMRHLSAVTGPKTVLGARWVAPLSIRHYPEMVGDSAYEAWATVFMRLSG